MTLITENPEERKYAKVARPYPYGTIDFTGDGFVIGAARMESKAPNMFRQAVYPSGKVVVQGAYAWTQGNEGGVVWRDLPLVKVDDEGNELV
jgi:hypothetical protein